MQPVSAGMLFYDAHDQLTSDLYDNGGPLGMTS